MLPSVFVRNLGLQAYRPVYEAMNVLCDGIILEAQSCEDDGAGLSFCVFVYNEQPGIVIDHATGESALA